MIERRNLNPRRQPDKRRSINRREKPRTKFEAEVRFLRVGDPANEVLHGELLDASVGGFRILFDDYLSPTDRILVEVTCANEHCFNLSAEVIWVEETQQGLQRVGCELSADLNPKQHKLLQQCATAATLIR